MDGLEPPILDETWGLEELNNGLGKNIYNHQQKSM